MKKSPAKGTKRSASPAKGKAAAKPVEAAQAVPAMPPAPSKGILDDNITSETFEQVSHFLDIDMAKNNHLIVRIINQLRIRVKLHTMFKVE